MGRGGCPARADLVPPRPEMGWDQKDGVPLCDERDPDVRRAPACTPDSVRAAAVATAALGRHLSGTAVAGGLERPTRVLGRAPFPTRPEPGGADAVWPCTPWGLPSRDRRRPRWWALTPPFHPSPVPRRGGTIGWSVLCCTCRRATPPGRRSERGGAGAFPLGSTVPCGVRTFLPGRGPRTAQPEAAARPTRRANVRAGARGVQAPARASSRRAGGAARRPAPPPPRTAPRRRRCGRRARRR